MSDLTPAERLRLPDTVDTSSVGASLRWLTVPLAAFVVTRLLVLGIVFLADAILPGFNDTWFFRDADIGANFVQSWYRWDSVWYVDIIENGYVYSPDNPRSTVAFFPLYPLVVRALDSIVGNVLLTGLLVSNLCFLAALIVLYQFVQLKWSDESTARRAVFYLAAFPLSFFFSAVYTESLFLLLTVLAFYLAERRQWGWAALAGTLASATRVTGVLVWGAVTLLWLADHGWTLATILRSQAWRNLVRALRVDGLSFLVLMIMPFGLLAFMLYLYLTFGDPLAFSQAHSGWRQPAGIQPLLNDLSLLLSGRLWPTYILDLAAAVGVLLLAPLIWHRLGAAYALYVALAVVVPLSTGVMSFMRFGMVLFPVFMILARWGRRRWLDVLIRVSWLALLPLFTLAFLKWVFVG